MSCSKDMQHAARLPLHQQWMVSLYQGSLIISLMTSFRSAHEGDRHSRYSVFSPVHLDLHLVGLVPQRLQLVSHPALLQIQVQPLTGGKFVHLIPTSIAKQACQPDASSIVTVPSMEIELSSVSACNTAQLCLKVASQTAQPERMAPPMRMLRCAASPAVGASAVW